MGECIGLGMAGEQGRRVSSRGRLLLVAAALLAGTSCQEMVAPVTVESCVADLDCRVVLEASEFSEVARQQFVTVKLRLVHAASGTGLGGIRLWLDRENPFFCRNDLCRRNKLWCPSEPFLTDPDGRFEARCQVPIDVLTQVYQIRTYFQMEDSTARQGMLEVRLPTPPVVSIRLRLPWPGDTVTLPEDPTKAIRVFGLDSAGRMRALSGAAIATTDAGGALAIECPTDVYARPTCGIMVPRGGAAVRRVTVRDGAASASFVVRERVPWLAEVLGTVKAYPIQMDSTVPYTLEEGPEGYRGVVVGDTVERTPWLASAVKPSAFAARGSVFAVVFERSSPRQALVWQHRPGAGWTAFNALPMMGAQAVTVLALDSLGRPIVGLNDSLSTLAQWDGDAWVPTTRRPERLSGGGWVAFPAGLWRFTTNGSTYFAPGQAPRILDYKFNSSTGDFNTRFELPGQAGSDVIGVRFADGVGVVARDFAVGYRDYVLRKQLTRFLGDGTTRGVADLPKDPAGFAPLLRGIDFAPKGPLTVRVTMGEEWDLWTWRFRAGAWRPVDDWNAIAETSGKPSSSYQAVWVDSTTVIGRNFDGQLVRYRRP